MKLNQIQQKLKAPKSQYNNFGKYSYRNCEDILEAVKPLLEDSVLMISDEVVNIGDRYYVKATATFIDGTETNQVTAYAREANEQKGMGEAQITGSASSYARKYALNGLFLIDDTKDDDHNDNSAKVATKPKILANKPISAYQSAQNAINNAKTPEELTVLAERVNNSEILNDTEKQQLINLISNKENQI